MDRASVPEMRPAKEQKTGSLIIVGSGLRSIGQITLETIMHIEAADKVFYLVTDPTTEGFILGKNKNCVDLYQYYSNTKQRMETYVQMAEVSSLLTIFNSFTQAPVCSLLILAS